MKKIMTLILTILLICSFSACNTSETSIENTPTAEIAQVTEVKESEAVPAISFSIPEETMDSILSWFDEKYYSQFMSEGEIFEVSVGIADEECGKLVFFVNEMNIEQSQAIIEETFGASFDENPNIYNDADNGVVYIIHESEDGVMIRYDFFGGEIADMIIGKNLFDEVEAILPDVTPISENILTVNNDSRYFNFSYEYSENEFNDIWSEYQDELKQLGKYDYIDEGDFWLSEVLLDNNIIIESHADSNWDRFNVRLYESREEYYEDDNDNGNDDGDLEDNQETDNSYYSEVYPIIEEMFFDNLFNVYLDTIAEHITSFEYYYGTQGGITLRAYIDISAIEAVFMLGDSEMDIQVSETGFEEITVEYPDIEGTVVFKDGSLFFEDFDLSCITPQNIIDIFPNELFPKITKEQGENDIDIILVNDGSINIYQQNVYGSNDQQYLMNKFKEELTDKYSVDPHQWEGKDVYEVYLPRGGEYRAEVGDFIIGSSVIINNSSANKVIDQEILNEFFTTVTSEKLYELLGESIYKVLVTIDDSGEIMFVDNQSEFYKVETGESLSYVFEFDKHIDMSELTYEIQKSFPDYNARVEANGEMQFWSYEEKEVFGLFKNTNNSDMSAYIMLNIFDIPEKNPIDEISLEEKYDDFLSVPLDFTNAGDMAKDIEINVENDGYAVVLYFNEFYINNMKFNDVVSIMEEHFNDTMGDFDKTFEGESTILFSVDDIGCMEIAHDNGSVKVYIILENRN